MSDQIEKHKVEIVLKYFYGDELRIHITDGMSFKITEDDSRGVFKATIINSRSMDELNYGQNIVNFVDVYNEIDSDNIIEFQHIVNDMIVNHKAGLKFNKSYSFASNSKYGSSFSDQLIEIIKEGV